MASGSAYIYVLTSLGEGPSHGLGIAEDVAEFTGGETILGPGTLYRCLHELADEGLIARSEPPDGEGDGSPHRKYYRITEAGRARLDRDLAELHRLVRTGRRRLERLRPAEAT